jgi:uncharacterized membrane-anchored protein
MARSSSISKSLLITTIGGAAFAAVVIISVLVPLKLKGLLPYYNWSAIVACPLLAFYLLSGTVVTSLISDRLGFESFSAKSILVDFAYLSIMVLVIVAIVAFS